jgi:GTP-binding protein
VSHPASMQAEFIACAVTEQNFPHEGIPEIVIAGRSNVGKSSLINRLAGKKGIARTSSTPGKTQSINFYRFDGDFCLVDLPGYGYAKAGKAASRKWSRLIEQYFRVRSTVRLVIHLVDSRHGPTKLDLQLEEWLNELRMPRLIVATKADKLSGNEKAVQQRVISAAFHGEPVILASAVTGIGCKELWNRVVEAARSR